MRLLITALLLLFSLSAQADEPRTLTWDDLLPEGEVELIEKMLRESAPAPMIGHSSETDFNMMPEQIGTFNTVAKLNGQRVRIPGYVVPLDYAENGDVTEFLLVPYQGACIHYPPPPPNQIVFVRSKNAKDFGPTFRPVWITGVMKTETVLNGLGNTAYALDLQEWTPYED